MGALEFDFWGWSEGGGSDRRGHPTNLHLPTTPAASFRSCPPRPPLPRYTFYLSLASPTSECPWDTYLHSAVSFQHSGAGGEKKSHTALSKRKWFCFTIRMNVVIKIGLFLPAWEGVPSSFHAFSLWLCDLVACLSAIPLSPSIMHRFSILYSPPSSLSFQPRSAAEEAFAFVPFKAMLPPQQRTIARSFAPPLPLPSSY